MNLAGIVTVVDGMNVTCVMEMDGVNVLSVVEMDISS